MSYLQFNSVNWNEDDMFDQEMSCHKWFVRASRNERMRLEVGPIGNIERYFKFQLSWC